MAETKTNLGARISIPPMTPLEPPFRLPESWYRKNMARLQASLAENGLDGMILEDVWNIIYFSGLFHSKTERPLWLFVPAAGEPVIYHPALDRDLVDTWWIQDAEWYFDYPHHGAYNRMVYEPGPPQDLSQWMLGRLAARGYAQAALGIESEVGASVAARMQQALPQATFQVMGDVCLKMRQVKSPKVYVRDSGLLHQLLGIDTMKALVTHPKVGASWEGFVVEQLLMTVDHDEAFFWATHQGAEIDLVLRRGTDLYGVECKRSDTPRMTKSIMIALNDLNLTGIAVVYPGSKRFPIADRVEAVPLRSIGEGIEIFGSIGR